MFCNQCGTQLPDGTAFCTNCGAATGNPQPQASTAQQQTYQQQQYQPQKPVFVDDFDPEEKDKYRVLSALTYVNIVFVILALVAKPDSKVVRFHANQALCLTLFFLLASLCAIVPFIGWVAAGVGYITGIVFLFMGFFRALGRKAVELPLFGQNRIFD